jgi:hypothetical protein
MSDLYEKDFYQWTIEQGALLRARKLDEADIENLAEEIESVGRGLQDELGDRMADLLRYMLRWTLEPEKRNHNLQSDLREQMTWIATLVDQSPSLLRKVPEELPDSYHIARLRAARDLDVDEATFAAPCPWTFEQMIDFNNYDDRL